MPDTTVDTRQSREDLAMWLRAGRTQRKLSLEDVAKITKIQPRILDKLERGELEGLPAEVFVKGFVRSFAKCVGLDESEAILRYTACASGTIPATAKALVESMGLARTKAMGTPAQPTKVVAAPVEAPVEASSETPAVASPVEIAPVEVAPVEVAPVEVAPVEVAPVEVAPVEVAAIEIAPVEVRAIEIAPVEVRAVVIAPVEIAQVAPIDVAPVEIAPVEVAVADAPVEVAAVAAVEVSAAEPVDTSKKKRSRKKGKGARRAKKQTDAPIVEAAAVVEQTDAPIVEAAAVVEPTAAVDAVDAPVEAIATDAAPVDEDALTTQIAKVSLDAGPVAMTDGESLDTISIEAKTNERSHDASADLEIDLVDGAVSEPHLATGSDRISANTTAVEVADGEPEIASTGTWQPTMPPIATTPSVPWRRPHITASRAYVVPSLVIDDADPDSADRERDQRSDPGKEHRLSFLPPILLDREDRSARQGGLTLAVIILLIAATLTLSYLMRRPSSSGDGVTLNDTPDTHAQLLS